MAVNLSALAGAGQQFFDNNGVILSGGKLYSYAAGTSTPQTTYTSASGSTAHTNPIVLDSAGRVATGEIWLTAGSNYKFALYTSANVLITTWDNITGINGTGITSNASNVQYDPAGAGAVATTVQAKLRESVSVKDFGAVGDGVTNDSVAIQAAMDSGAPCVVFPGGTYLFTSVTLSNPVTILGNNSTLKLRIITPAEVATLSATVAYPLFYIASDNISFQNCRFDGNRFSQTALHSDNIIAHRWLCAMTGLDNDYSNFTLQNCEFYEFINAIVCVCGDTFEISDCIFRDSNTGSLMLGLAQPSVELLHSVDTLLISNCNIRNIGTRTSANDPRNYGHDLPVVTGDGMITRGGNITISNVIFNNIDRSAIKLEQSRQNIILTGIVAVNKNLTDGLVEYRALQFASPHPDYYGTATVPNNFVISNSIFSTFTSFGQVWGMIVSNNQMIMSPSADITSVEACGLITASVGIGSGNYCITNNNILVSKNTIKGIKITTGTGLPITGMLIANNNIKTTNNTGIHFNSTNEFLNDINVISNTISTSATALSLDFGDTKLNKTVVNNNNIYSIAMRGSNTANRTEVIITNNVSQLAINAAAADILVRDNIVKTLTGTRAVDTAKTILSSYYDSQTGGEFYTSTSGDTTPSVKGINIIFKNDAAPTTVTTFTNGFDGQIITVLFGSANTTLSNNAGLRLAGAANVTPTANSSLSFVFKATGWFEISRSIY